MGGIEAEARMMAEFGGVRWVGVCTLLRCLTEKMREIGLKE